MLAAMQRLLPVTAVMPLSANLRQAVIQTS